MTQPNYTYWCRVCCASVKVLATKLEVLKKKNTRCAHEASTLH